MNKSELINRISKEFNVSEIEASEFFESFLALLTKTFRKGKNINISGFGKLRTFTKYIEDGRRGKFIAFSPVKKLADEVNKDFNDLFATTVALLNDKSRFDLISLEELEPEEDSIIVFDDSGYEDIPVEEFLPVNELEETEPDEAVNDHMQDLILEELTTDEKATDVAGGTLKDPRQDSIVEELTTDKKATDEAEPEALDNIQQPDQTEMPVDEDEQSFENPLEIPGIDEAINSSVDPIDNVIESAPEIKSEASPIDEIGNVPTESKELSNTIETDAEATDEEQPEIIADRDTEIIPYKEEIIEEFTDPDDLLPKNVKDDVIENVIPTTEELPGLTDDLMDLIRERRKLFLESENGDTEIPEKEPEPDIQVSDKDERVEIIDRDELSKVEEEREKFFASREEKKEITNILEEYGIYREPVDDSQNEEAVSDNTTVENGTSSDTLSPEISASGENTVAENSEIPTEPIIPQDLRALHEEISSDAPKQEQSPKQYEGTPYDEVFEVRSETETVKPRQQKPGYNIGLNNDLPKDKEDSRIFSTSLIILIAIIVLISLLTYGVFKFGLIGSENEPQKEPIIEDRLREDFNEEPQQENQTGQNLLKSDDTTKVSQQENTKSETTDQLRELDSREEEQIAFPEAGVVLINTSNGAFIQVGSYSNENVAKQKVDNLKRNGADAFIVKSELERGIFYRVRIGKFNSLDSAKQFAVNKLK